MENNKQTVFLLNGMISLTITSNENDDSLSPIIKIQQEKSSDKVYLINISATEISSLNDSSNNCKSKHFYCSTQ